MSLESLRQTVVTLLARALSELFPGAKILETAVNNIGFTLEAVLPQSIDKDAFPLIEERMYAIVRERPRVRLLEMMPSNATDFLLHHKQPLRALKLEGYLDPLVQLVQIGDFVDICFIPPEEDLSKVKAFKLQSITSREPFENEGDELVTCIYGTAFFDKSELKQFLKRVDLAQQYDHRGLGQEMQLYMQLEHTGLWLWKPNGMVLKSLLKEWEEKQWQPLNVKRVGLTPLVPAKFEDENKIFIDGRLFDLQVNAFELSNKIFESEQDQNLPVHYSIQKQVYSFSPYSQLEGLLKTRCSEVNEIQTFCAPEKLYEQLTSSLQIIKKAIRIFPFDMEWTFCSQSPKGFKNRKGWKEAVELLQKAIEDCGIEYILDTKTINSDGPKIEVRIDDALGRKWPVSYLLMNVLNMTGNPPHFAGMTQSVLGMIERFIALLIEKTGGNLPLWLTPEQVKIIPISKEYFDDAMTIADMIQSVGARCSVNRQPGVLGEKVHRAMTERVPYVILVGEREKQQGVVSVRSRKSEERKMTISDFVEQLQQQLKEAEVEQNKRSW